VDDLEGMTLGPRLSDGRRSLIVLSDHNFSGRQITRFTALSMHLPACLMKGRGVHIKK